MVFGALIRVRGGPWTRSQGLLPGGGGILYSNNMMARCLIAGSVVVDCLAARSLDWREAKRAKQGIV